MRYDILPEVESTTHDDIAVVGKRKNANRWYDGAYNFPECVTSSIKMNEEPNIDEGVEVITEILEMDMYTLEVLHSRSMQLGDMPENTI